MNDKLNVTKIFARNIQAGLLSKLFGAFVVFLTTPIIIDSLGNEIYGLWMTIGQAIVFFGSLEFGLLGSVGRFVAKYNGSNDEKGINKTINNGLLLFIVFAFFVIILSFVLIKNIEFFLDISSDQHDRSIKLITILSIGLSIDFICRIGKGVATGFHRYDLIYKTQIFGNLFKLIYIFLFFFYLASKNIFLLGYLSVITMIIPNIIVIFFIFPKISKYFQLRLKYFSLEKVKELVSLGGANIITNSLAGILKSVTLVVIANNFLLSSVAIYAIPASLLVYPSMLVNTFLLSFTNIGSELKSREQESIINSMVLIGIKYSLAMNIGFFIGVLVFGKTFLTLWVGKNFTFLELDTMFLILSIMSASFITLQLIEPLAKVLKGTGKHWLVGIVSIVINLFGFFLGYFIMINQSFGLPGMAIGYLISGLISSFLIYPIIMLKYKISDLKLFFKNIISCILYIACPLSIISFLMNIIKYNSWLILIFWAMFFSAIFLLLFYYLILEERHKKYFLKKLVFKSHT